MSEATDFHPSPPLPVARRPHARSVLRPGRVVRPDQATSAPPDDKPSYPLDPPLVDVRIPVEAPHAAATAYSRIALRHRFPRAQVGDDLHMLFSEPGKEKQSRLSPDVFVALDVPRRGTRTEYDADRLGPPDFVLEVLSRSTWHLDLGRKLDCYQEIGVRECLLFNATGKGLPQVGRELWGYSLTPERREPLEEAALANGERGVRSAVLGLVAYVSERTPPSGPGEIWALTMRWHDPATGEDIPDYEQSRAGEARARAHASPARAEERAERARTQAERARANAAQAERARAESERARAEAGQRRIAELESAIAKFAEFRESPQ